MPYVNIKVTPHSAKPGQGPVTAEEKAAIIEGVSKVLLNVLDKPLESTLVLIEEIADENWGRGGLSWPDYQRRQTSK